MQIVHCMIYVAFYRKNGLHLQYRFAKYFIYVMSYQDNINH